MYKYIYSLHTLEVAYTQSTHDEIITTNTLLNHRLREKLIHMHTHTQYTYERGKRTLNKNEKKKKKYKYILVSLEREHMLAAPLPYGNGISLCVWVCACICVNLNRRWNSNKPTTLAHNSTCVWVCSTQHNNMTENWTKKRPKSAHTYFIWIGMLFVRTISRLAGWSVGQHLYLLIYKLTSSVSVFVVLAASCRLCFPLPSDLLYRFSSLLILSLSIHNKTRLMRVFVLIWNFKQMYQLLCILQFEQICCCCCCTHTRARME